MNKVSYGTITLTDTIDTDLLGGHFIYNGDGAGVIQNIGNGPSNWGFNTWIGSNGIQLRDAATPYATLNAEGLTLSKGGIKANITDQNNRVYISSEDYPRAYYEKTEDTVIDNTKTYYILNDDVFEAVDNPVVEDIENYYNFVPGLVINGYEPISNYDDPAFRLIVGSKFGVDSQGRMYASNANIQGEIVTAAGRIGPWFINASSISRNANGDAAGSYNTPSNLYFGTSGLSLGDTFTVNSAGYLTATNGIIGGWNISPTALCSATTYTPDSGRILLAPTGVTTSSAVGNLPPATYAITAGSDFGVTTAGKLYATGADITGEIHATSGTIAQGIIIGDIEKAHITTTNEGIEFWNNGIKTAYINGNYMYIPYSVVLNEMIVGQRIDSQAEQKVDLWSWRKMSNENLRLMWLGGEVE